MRRNVRGQSVSVLSETRGWQRPGKTVSSAEVGLGESRLNVSNRRGLFRAFFPAGV